MHKKKKNAKNGYFLNFDNNIIKRGGRVGGMVTYNILKEGEGE